MLNCKCSIGRIHYVVNNLYNVTKWTEICHILSTSGVLSQNWRQTPECPNISISHCCHDSTRFGQLSVMLSCAKLLNWTALIGSQCTNELYTEMC